METRKSRQNLLAKFDKRWLGSGLAAAAGAVAMADPASAAVVWHHSVGSGGTLPAAGVNVPSTFAGIYINMQTEVNATTTGGAPGWDLNPYGSTYLRIYVDTTGAALKGAGAASTFDNLASGAQICPGDAFHSTPGSGGFGMDINPGTPLNLNSSNNLVGFRFVDGGTVTRVGWMRFQLGAANAGVQPRNIVEWAYEDTQGSCIGAGVTPEPTSLGLLAAGAGGLLLRRRRKA